MEINVRNTMKKKQKLTITNKKMLENSNLQDTEKEIVLSVVEKEVAIKIVEAIKEKAGVGTAAHGLCFFLPVEMSTISLVNNEMHS